jgi:DNA-binding Lrp family transcriptional regulator
MNKINKLQFVKEVTPVYGEYDIIVETETKTIKELTLFIYNKLRTIPGLTMTTTMITAKINKKKF